MSHPRVLGDSHGILKVNEKITTEDKWDDGDLVLESLYAV